MVQAPRAARYRDAKKQRTTIDQIIVASLVSCGRFWTRVQAAKVGGPAARESPDKVEWGAGDLVGAGIKLQLGCDEIVLSGGARGAAFSVAFTNLFAGSEACLPAMC